MFTLLHSQKVSLQVMWGQIAPSEPQADLTPAEIDTLREQWIKIAPHELFDYKATCLEDKGLFEIAHDTPDFFTPTPDEEGTWEEEFEKHKQSYILWK